MKIWLLSYNTSNVSLPERKIIGIAPNEFEMRKLLLKKTIKSEFNIDPEFWLKGSRAICELIGEGIESDASIQIIIDTYNMQGEQI